MKTFKVESGGGHKSICYKDNIYLFGGNTDTSSNKNLLFKFNTFTKNWTINNSLKGKSPESRTAHTCICYKDHLYVFSGAQDDDQDTDFEILKFDLINQTWTIITEDLEEVPEGRYGHSTILYQNKAIVFGGNDIISDEPCLDILEFNLDDIKDWNMYDSSKMPVLSFHTSDLLKDSNLVYHFGGVIIKRGMDVHVNTIYEYNIIERKCKEVKVQSECIPCGRRSHGSCMDDENGLYIFGGFTLEVFDGILTNKFLNDLWKFDFLKNEWKEIKYQGDVLKRRYFSISNYENGFYIFGGVHDEIIDQFGNDKLILLNDLVRFEWNSKKKSFIKMIYLHLKDLIFDDIIVKFNNKSD